MLMIKRAAAIFTAAFMVLMLSGCGGQYGKAYKKTEALDTYELFIYTSAVLNDGRNTKETVITQNVEAYHVGKKDMRYKVTTESVSYDAAGNEEAQTLTDYIYYDGNFYFTMPGVKYYSPAENYDSALATIEDLTDIISLPEDKMYNLSEYEGSYSYQIEGEDISDYVMSLLQYTANSAGEIPFAADNVSGTAYVEDGYVKGRTLTAHYTSRQGLEWFEINVETELVSTDADVEIPDKSQYADIQ